MSTQPKMLICRRGLHPMTDDNVWTRPSDQARYCRQCLRVARKKQPKVVDAAIPRMIRKANREIASEDYLYNDATEQRLTAEDLSALLGLTLWPAPKKKRQSNRLYHSSEKSQNENK